MLIDNEGHQRDKKVWQKINQISKVKFTTEKKRHKNSIKNKKNHRKWPKPFSLCLTLSHQFTPQDRFVSITPLYIKIFKSNVHVMTEYAKAEIWQNCDPFS